MLEFSTVDEHGVQNYKTRYLLLASVLFLYGVIAMASFGLLHYELQSVTANITTYKDAFWTLQMSASTIGFGDHYPVTLGGRSIVAAMFYIGVGVAGYIGSLIMGKIFSKTDTNVKNRELRSEIRNQNKIMDNQNDKIDKQNQKLDMLTKLLHENGKQNAIIQTQNAEEAELVAELLLELKSNNAQNAEIQQQNIAEAEVVQDTNSKVSEILDKVSSLTNITGNTVSKS